MGRIGQILFRLSSSGIPAMALSWFATSRIQQEQPTLLSDAVSRFFVVDCDCDFSVFGKIPLYFLPLIKFVSFVISLGIFPVQQKVPQVKI
jgi:hypothetical protein